jgi:hypothetical protein
MPDLFDFFRYSLGTVATIYALIVTFQSAWSWYIFLSGSDKYVALIRRYVIVHGLRLRFRAFWGDVIVSLLLCVAFVLLWVAHGRAERLRVALQSIRHPVVPVSRLIQHH